jgi:hypothetical protein
MGKPIKEVYNEQEDLRDKIFIFSLFGSIAMVLICAVNMIISGNSLWTVIYNGASALLLLMLFKLAFAKGKKNFARTFFIYFLNMAVMTYLFYINGGVNSGMAIYLVAGLLIIVLAEHGVKRYVALVLCSIFHVVSIIVSYNYMGEQAKDHDRPKIIPDMYFVGFQEVVKLNATNIIITGEDKLQQILNEWDKKVYESISKIGKYKKLVIMNLVGINFFSYILEDKYDRVKNISKKIVKTGFGGTTGNKGSCVINFDYENTNFCISCSHLVANKKNKRIKELEYILNLKLNTFYNPEKFKDKSNEQMEIINQTLEEIMAPEEELTKNPHSNSICLANNTGLNALNKNENSNSNDSILFKDSDVWILFGDLNFRIDMEYEEFSEFIKNGNSWDKLLDYDQFVKYQLASLSSNTYIKEDIIKFAPTYKYIINSDEFDYTPKDKIQNPKEKESENLHKSGKKRNPSWCDRIFYKKNSFTTKEGKKIITGIEYNSVMDKNFQSSDHRPVYEIFEVIIFKENQDKKDLIEKEIISNENLGISNKYMKQKVYDY